MQLLSSEHCIPGIANYSQLLQRETGRYREDHASTRRGDRGVSGKFSCVEVLGGGGKNEKRVSISIVYLSI